MRRWIAQPLAVLLLGSHLSGCSVMLQPVPPDSVRPGDPVECDDDPTWPKFDQGLATGPLLVALLLTAIIDDKPETARNEKAQAALLIPVTLVTAIPFGLSARAGFRRVKKCKQLKAPPPEPPAPPPMPLYPQPQPYPYPPPYPYPAPPPYPYPQPYPAPPPAPGPGLQP
jgi:hypothetical protein